MLKFGMSSPAINFAGELIISLSDRELMHRLPSYYVL